MTSRIERFAEALGSRYEVERELGTGGTATVYLAKDLKYQRRVAVKVFRPEVAEAMGHERFVREIAFVATLNHPHIVPLLDSGEAEELLYYVMPAVEGESLRDRLAREGTLPWTKRSRLPETWRWRWTTRTSATWCTATSSRRTSCSRRGRRWWPTSGSRRW
ncbi:MAG: protein kinase [Gemmatimonadetes bacterium]|nr:protein kinase [Gemmatimonadota bacterium]